MISTTLLPIPDIFQWNQGKIEVKKLSILEKIKHIAIQCIKLVATVISLPFVYIHSKLFKSKVEEVSSKHTFNPLPKDVGFADSHFQTIGLGTKHSAVKLDGTCNWDSYLTPNKIEGTEDKNYDKFFTDILTDPAPFIEILKETNATSYRFSLEWSIIEPTPNGHNDQAIKLYKNFIKNLKDNDIEPYVTLVHFVIPQWLEENGGFAEKENIELYKNHALKMIETFPEVTNWMTFNEINIEGFQSCIRGVYPPGKEGDFALAGRKIRNMLVAHCLTYKEAKKRWPEKQIGVTHQWLKFEPLSGNFLEKMICETLSQIVHYACFNFFKTGKFSYQMPLKANVQFSIPEDEFKINKGFTDFFGVQFYGFPRLKAGFNGGVEYPGYKVTNLIWKKIGLTFGSTCNPDSEMMSFGPAVYPEDLSRALDEAKVLKKPIVISEIGCDAKTQKFGEKEFKLHDETQKKYYETISPILEKYPLKALFFWTVLRNHLEWDRGDFPQLGAVNILKDQSRKIVSHQLSPGAKYLSTFFNKTVDKEKVA